MPARRRFPPATLAPVAAALIALGCVAAPDVPSAPRSGGAPPATRTAEPAGADADGTDTPDEFAARIRTAFRPYR